MIKSIISIPGNTILLVCFVEFNVAVFITNQVYVYRLTLT